MNTLHFKYAIEIEKTGSITQAAENLFMAQPNLSRAIKELEDNLGIVIFERNSKGVAPTKAGREFLSYAKIIVEQLDKMESINIPKDLNRQTLNVSIPRSSYISRAVTKFTSKLDESKAIFLNIQETGSMKAIDNILNGHFNMGIIRYQISYEGYFMEYLSEKNLSYDIIWEAAYLVLMSKNHCLANAETVTQSELQKYTEILHGDSVIPYLGNGDLKDGKHKDFEKKIYVYERGSQFDMLTHIPSTYMWVSPVPEDILERYGLVQRKCNAPNNSFKDLVIYKKGYKFTEFDKKFIDEVYSCKNEVAYKEYI